METRFISQEFIYPDSRLNQLSWGRLTEVQKHDEATDWLATHKDLILWLVNQYRTNVVITKADLFQEAMLAAWEAFDNYDSNRVDVLLETYLFVVMDNAIKEVFRRVFAQKRQAQEQSVYFVDLANQEGCDELDAIENAGGYAGSAEDEAESNEGIKFWQERINNLPESLKTVMKLHIAGMTQVQIAKKLGISQSTVSVQLKKARGILAKYRTEDILDYSLEEYAV